MTFSDAVGEVLLTFLHMTSYFLQVSEPFFLSSGCAYFLSLRHPAERMLSMKLGMRHDSRAWAEKNIRQKSTTRKSWKVGMLNPEHKKKESMYRGKEKGRHL